MPVTVKKVQLWRAEVENRPGVLAQTLKPLAEAGADLCVVMGYRYPGQEKAAIELYPVSGKKMEAAAAGGGLAAAGIPTLLVEGDNKPGLGHALAEALGGAGVNINFLVAQVAGKKFSAVYGFDNEADAKKAAQVIKKAAAPKKKK